MSGEPVSAAKLSKIFSLDHMGVVVIMNALREDLDAGNRGVRLAIMEDTYQLCTRGEYAAYVRNALEIKRNTPLTSASMEVLAIVAYHQPVTKAFVEQVRSVDCGYIVNSLVEKRLLEERGRLDVPGKPIQYGTTENFLRCFNLTSLDDLPGVELIGDDDINIYDKAENEDKNVDDEDQLTFDDM